jgi:hypothetical protein
MKTVWYGEEITTDIDPHIHFSGTDSNEKTTEELIEMIIGDLKITREKTD